ncbi:MAG: hypothetical protein QM728_03280 [Gordonia sp. (in: high G+C Gram-positive bacteria)]|uniref:hypothetical protein n=1 Tax=Gordonia sp. (in: high G+C Gram-positive bacteria) TaxID=84139 RepID=UPI0039E67691
MRWFGRGTVWGRGDIERAVADWPEEQRYEAMVRWTARYLPLWHDAFARYADDVDLAPDKRELFTARMTELIERCADIRRGERVVKARIKETESAISALSNGAARHYAAQPWNPQIRTAALTARHLLRAAEEGADAEKLAAGVYSWAEIESGFPGDSSSLLQALTTAERAAAGHGFYDGHHLLYGRPCQQAGLAAEGRAVYASVARIMADLGADPGPFPTPEGFWTLRPSPAVEQADMAYEAFHSHRPPRW